MSTTSHRRDHDLIDKVIKSMETTVQLFESGKTIPESILVPVIDFSKNFTYVCHHSKEEKSLFPALEKTGMPTRMGPIAKMLMEHTRLQNVSKQVDEDINQIEKVKLNEIGKTREEYEQIAQEFEKKISRESSK